MMVVSHRRSDGNQLCCALQETQASAADGGIDFRQRLSQVVGDMGQIDWLVPPMLQKA